MYELNFFGNICALKVFEGSSTKVKVGIKPNEGYNKKSPAIFHFQPQKRVSVETRVATAVGNLGNAFFSLLLSPHLFAGSLHPRALMSVGIRICQRARKNSVWFLAVILGEVANSAPAKKREEEKKSLFCD